MDRQTGGQMDRQAGGQMDRQTGGQVDRQTGGQMDRQAGMYTGYRYTLAQNGQEVNGKTHTNPKYRLLSWIKHD